MSSRSQFPLLMSPFELRGRMLRNRIVSTPHATGWSHDGLIDQTEIDYHVRKAAGGAGLVMTFGSASVDPTTQASYGSIALWDERNEPALRALAEGVHRHGALCMSQMTHMGRRGNSLTSGVPLRAPSDLPEGSHLEVPVPLDADELPAIVERFAAAARRLEQCGWDGAEVTSFGGHLIEQFFDPQVNTRTDAYGGSLENRTRFGREVLEAVRAAVSDDFIVGLRMAVDQCLTGGLGPEDMIEIARSLTSSGAVDLISVSGGTGATRLATAYFVPGDELPEGVYNERAARFRHAVDVPVLVAGRNVEPEVAEAALSAGVDLVAMTRAIIADPDLPLKVAAGERKRPCISLNEGCIGRLYTGLPMWCSVNPAIREPELARLTPAADPGRIVVVGGGVAGLEAARAAALRGHHVVVFERRPDLGGRARLAAERRGRERWRLYVDWLRDEAVDAGVEIRLGASADVAAVLAEQPDAVILATGSRLRDEAPPSGTPLLDVDTPSRARPAGRRDLPRPGPRRRRRVPGADGCGGARRRRMHRRDRDDAHQRGDLDRPDPAAVRAAAAGARRRRAVAQPGVGPRRGCAISRGSTPVPPGMGACHDHWSPVRARCRSRWKVSRRHRPGVLRHRAAVSRRRHRARSRPAASRRRRPRPRPRPARSAARPRPPARSRPAAGFRR